MKRTRPSRTIQRARAAQNVIRNYITFVGLIIGLPVSFWQEAKKLSARKARTAASVSSPISHTHTHHERIRLHDETMERLVLAIGQQSRSDNRPLSPPAEVVRHGHEHAQPAQFGDGFDGASARSHQRHPGPWRGRRGTKADGRQLFDFS